MALWLFSISVLIIAIASTTAGYLFYSFSFTLNFKVSNTKKARNLRAFNLVL